MEKATLQIGKFICGVTNVAISCAEDAIKKFKEYNAQMNEVHKRVKNASLIQCPCEIISYDPSFFDFDTELLISISKNDTPASIAEAVVKHLKRRY